MIKKYVVQLIGVALILLGFYYIYRYVSREILQSTGLTAEIFIGVFLNLVFSGIAIYGGIHLFRLQEVGRKLAIIWLSWILFVVITTKLPSYISGASPFLAPSKIWYLVFIISGYLFYALAFISLLDNKTIDLMSNNDYLTQRIGTILSFCAPGLGRALTENFFLGMGLFICYVFIMKALSSQEDLASIIFLGFVTWKIFSSIDFAAVKKRFKVEQTELAIKENEL